MIDGRDVAFIFPMKDFPHEGRRPIFHRLKHFLFAGMDSSG